MHTINRPHPHRHLILRHLPPGKWRESAVRITSNEQRGNVAHRTLFIWRTFGSADDKNQRAWWTLSMIQFLVPLFSFTSRSKVCIARDLNTILCPCGAAAIPESSAQFNESYISFDVDVNTYHNFHRTPSFSLLWNSPVYTSFRCDCAINLPHRIKIKKKTKLEAAI